MDLVKEIAEKTKELSNKQKSNILKMIDTVSIIDDEIELESRIDKLIENEVRE